MQTNFLSLLDLTAEEAMGVVRRAREMKETGFRGDILENKIAIMIFEKSSTRTRVSFEVGVRQLGGQVVFMTPAESQLGRSEPLRDTARVLSRYGDLMIVRTFGQEKLEELAEFGDIPVINALSDSFHPCQLLADVLTMYEHTPDLASLRVAWVGDGNNMANSWINAARLFGFELRLACPEGYNPDSAVLNSALEAGARISVVRDPKDAVKDAHYVNTDVWASMGQEQEQKEREAAFAGYEVNSELLGFADPDVKVLHCLPAHRGEEISDEVMEGPASVIWDEAENRLHAQKALMEWVLTRNAHQ